MSDGTRPTDVRLYAVLVGLLLFAIGLAALLATPVWPKAPRPSRWSLRLDEPVEPTPNRK